MEGEEESGREVAEVGETMELSINSILGLTNSKTMKIKGQIGQQEMMSWWVAGQLITSASFTLRSRVFNSSCDVTFFESF